MKGRFLSLTILSMAACLGATSCVWSDSENQEREMFVVAQCPVEDDGCAPVVKKPKAQAPAGAGDSVIAQSKPARPKAQSVQQKQYAAVQRQEAAKSVVSAQKSAKDAPSTLSESVRGTITTAEQDQSADSLRVVTTKITEESEKTISARGSKKTEARLMRSEQSMMTLTEKVRYGEEVNDWDAAMGESLRSLLMTWGEEAGWTIVWKMDRDYILEAGVVFRGTFMEVSGSLIRSFARATPAPIGTFYKGNRVLVVSIVEDENAN